MVNAKCKINGTHTLCFCRAMVSDREEASLVQAFWNYMLGDDDDDEYTEDLSHNFLLDLARSFFLVL